MKPVSIYSALGLEETASDQEVSYALRKALRDSYKKTRDNFSVLENTLRFYNQASQVLNDKNRRKLYDTEWSLLNASDSQRIDFVLREAAEGKLAKPLPGGLPDIDATGGVRVPSEPDKTPQKDVIGEQTPGNVEPEKMVLSLKASNLSDGQGSASGKAPQKQEGDESQPREASSAATDPSKEPASKPGTEETSIHERVEAVSTTERAGAVPTPEPIEAASEPEDDPTKSKTELPAPPTTQHFHPILTENIGYSRSLIFQGFSTGLTALLIGALFYAAWEYTIKPFDVVQSWVWVVGALLMLALYGVGWNRGLRRQEKDFELPGPINETAIKSWRRKRTVFLGSNYLEEDPSWVFQLRLAELERSRIRRTSYPRLWRRALARLFDYALWGWLLFFPFHELARIELISQSVFQLISNPLMVLALITLTWIPVEALLMAAVGTTLGKWLFGVYVQFQVSTPYAPRGGGDCWGYALRRAFRVWWQGMGMGIAPLAPIAAAQARAVAERYDETDWDEELDVLVTHTPMSTVQRLVGGLGLAILAFMYLAVWQQPLYESGGDVSAWWMQQIKEQRSADFRETKPTSISTDVSVAADPDGTPVSDSINSWVEDSRREFEEFRKAIVRIREESLILLEKKDWARAHESCQSWAQLEVTNPTPRRCQGVALQAMGRHQEAINMFRSAKVYSSPEDRSLDEAIARSQDEIFKELIRRR